MRELVETQRQNLIKTLQRMQRQINNNPNADAYVREYGAEIAKYTGMRDGGDGGNFRDSDVSIRELHFSQWRDSDFQLMLEALGETEQIDDAEWEKRFGHERGLLSKWFGKGGRPQ
jgi:hypothetical protein